MVDAIRTNGVSPSIRCIRVEYNLGHSILIRSRGDLAEDLI